MCCMQSISVYRVGFDLIEFSLPRDSSLADGVCGRQCTDLRSSIFARYVTSNAPLNKRQAGRRLDTRALSNDVIMPGSTIRQESGPY